MTSVHVAFPRKATHRMVCLCNPSERLSVDAEARAKFERRTRKRSRRRRRTREAERATKTDAHKGSKVRRLTVRMNERPDEIQTDRLTLAAGSGCSLRVDG